MSIIDRYSADFWEVWQEDDFIIYYQKDWVNLEPSFPIIKFQAEVPEDFEYYASVNVVVDVRNDNLPEEEYISSVKDNLGKFITGLDNLTINRNTDEHFVFHEISYTSNQEGFLIQHTQYLWLICNKAITLSFVCGLDAVSDFAKTKALIFNTFQIK